MSIKKIFFGTVGFILLGLGAVGTAIPVLPTTPFVLAAAACFSISSEIMNTWLRHSRIFGPFIENYRTKQGISKWHKVGSIIFLWAGLIISMCITQKKWLYIMLIIVGVCVTIHLLLIKTKTE